MNDKEQVLIAGAGPVGLVCAMRLSQAGIPVTVFEREERLLADPRAATTHPATLEMLAELGIEDQIEAQGLVCSEFNFWDRPSEDLIASFDHALLKDETDFPYVVQCEQFKLSGILLAELSAYPDCQVHFSHQVNAVDQQEDAVNILVTGPEGQGQFEGRFLIAADGGRSIVRKSADIDFQGFTYPERFVVLSTTFDFAAARPFAYRNYLADPDEWCNLFKVAADGPPGLWRAVFPTVVGETDSQVLDEDAIQKRLQKIVAKPDPYDVVHRNLYITHQRVAETFRKGRVLLAGDSAHLNNPIGGMGLNGGIHDAMNLTEKLSRVWAGEAEITELDRYDRQRRTIATEFIQQQTMENKRRLEEKLPAVRKEVLADLQATAEDPVRAKEFLMGTSMLNSVRRAASLE